MAILDCFNRLASELAIQRQLHAMLCHLVWGVAIFKKGHGREQQLLKISDDLV